MIFSPFLGCFPTILAGVSCLGFCCFPTRLPGPFYPLLLSEPIVILLASNTLSESLHKTLTAFEEYIFKDIFKFPHRSADSAIEVQATGDTLCSAYQQKP
jgi:hypothetical protein